MHILDALQMIPLGYIIRKEKPLNIVTPTAQIGKKKRKS